MSIMMEMNLNEFDFKKNYTKAYKRFLVRKKRAKLNLDNAKQTSINEVIAKINELKIKPDPIQAAELLKTLLTSSAWIGQAYIRSMKNLIKIDDFKKYTENPNQNHILDCVINDKELHPSFGSKTDVFKAIYLEFEKIHQDPSFNSKLVCPPINKTIVLVSGIFNEIFSTAAFERGVEHISKTHNTKYLIPRISGRKGSKYNVGLLERQLNDYIENHPNEKLWLIGYSKGGVDCLHYLKKNSEFADKHISGLSTIASPVLGSDHVNNSMLKILNALESFSESTWYQFFDTRIDFLAKEFRNSVSSNYQKPWFQKNHKLLPKNLFYTSVALESEWHESHIWMILTKLIFNSHKINDGIVDAEDALFPSYFQGENLGIVQGHHLVGSRSSAYSQEALIEAHVTYLNYYHKKVLSV